MRAASLLLVTGLLAAAIPAGAQRAPAPTPTFLPADVQALACAPTLVYEPPPKPLRITGGQDSTVRRMYIQGDFVTINAGSDNGIEAGQEYYVRRLQGVDEGDISRHNPGIIRTAGWIRIYATDNTMSLATVTHACDSIEVGDFLETFVLPTVPAISAELLPAQRENYGRIIAGTDRRRSFGNNDLFIVDRGSNHGVSVGSRFVIYKDKQVKGNFLFEVGEAAAVEVRPESSTLQALVARDALAAGDYVALRKEVVK